MIWLSPFSTEAFVLTININIITRRQVVSVSDRRLSRAAGGIVSERANKMTILSCANAHVVISYNGIGRDHRRETPNDWLASMPELASMSIGDAFASIREMADARLAQLPSAVDRRHSFILAGFERGRPMLGLISNYEAFEGPSRSSALERSEAKIIHPRQICLFTTGQDPVRPKRLWSEVQRVSGGLSEDRKLLKAAVKAIRDTAYRNRRTGAVSANLQSVVLDPFGRTKSNSHLLGRSTLYEMPNYIAPGMTAADIMIDTAPKGGKPSWWSKKYRGKPTLTESPCLSCGAPVPPGQERCGVCDAASPASS